MKKEYDPVWKRELVPSAVEDCANVTSRYEQQLELQLNKQHQNNLKNGKRQNSNGGQIDNFL